MSKMSTFILDKQIENPEPEKSYPFEYDEDYIKWSEQYAKESQEQQEKEPF